MVCISGRTTHSNPTLCFISSTVWLKNEITLFLQVSAPHHEWSLCDTHFGHAKKNVRQQFRTSIIEKPENIIAIFKQFNNVPVEILNTIQKRKIDTKLFLHFRNSFEVITSSKSKLKDFYGTE
jgi:hypothetical protein